MYRLVSGGVGLSFEDVGKGAPHLVLIHDLARDHTTFSFQIEHFRQNHRIVAVDLRGHGQSDGTEQEYTVAAFADDVAWMCYELGVYRPIVVGHGLGGLIALELAARYPDLPDALVVMDSSVVPTPEIHAFSRSFAERLQAPTFGVSQQAATSAREDTLAWDGTAAAGACHIPILYIEAGTGAADLRRLGEMCPDLTVSRTVGAGGFHQLEIPKQINAVIGDFLDLVSQS